jgi:hypothetical protein
LRDKPTTQTRFSKIMKSIRVLLFLVALVALFAALAPTAAHFFGACIALAVVTAALSVRITSRVCATTLAVDEILDDTLDAFTVEVPSMSLFGTDFSREIPKDKNIIAKIAGVPVVSSYDAATGFENGSQDADSLITDVPVTLNRFRHVTVKVKYLTQLGSSYNLFRSAPAWMAYALGKDMTDYGLSLVTAANLTNKYTEALANVSLDTMEGQRTQLNVQKAYNKGRFSIVNSGFAQALQGDQRVASNMFYAQRNGDQGYRVWNNIAGFGTVMEYVDLPAAGNLTTFSGDRRSLVYASRLPDIANFIQEAGVQFPQIARFSLRSAPNGMTLLGIVWQKSGTFDVLFTCAILYGASVGKQGGANDAITDKAGLRGVSA